MKPAPFDYVRPRDVAEAVRALGATPGAKALAGGQTLGPMLNLRLAQPALLVDITRIRELAAVSEDRDAITIGATVTHAAIEDGRVPDPTGGFWPASPGGSAIARSEPAGPSAEVWRMPTRRPTGSPRSPRSAPTS